MLLIYSNNEKQEKGLCVLVSSWQRLKKQKRGCVDLLQSSQKRINCDVKSIKTVYQEMKELRQTQILQKILKNGKKDRSVSLLLSEC